MESIIAGPARHRHDDGCRVVSGSIRVGDVHHDLTYRVPDAATADGADAFLAAALLPAMRLGRPLRIDGAVSPALLGTVSGIQDIFHCWDDSYQKIPIASAALADATPPRGRGVGCFFSGGLDSCYTLLKHREEITHIIFVHGFDIALANHALRAHVSRELRTVASALGKSLIEVEANVREFCDRYVDWEMAHGACLASVALLLAASLSRVYIAASNTYRWLLPWGSHPLLDPLWSTERTAIVHDGCEYMRIDKLACIVRDETLLRSLRVCWENRDGAYNCGRCEKCLRMMVELRIMGALDRCTAFDRPLDLAAVSRIVIPYAPARYSYEQLLKRAEQSGTDPDLAAALRDCLSGRYDHGIRPVLRTVRNRLRRVLR